jgi:mycothiol synthase
MSVFLSDLDQTDAAAVADFHSVAAAATAVDGYRPFNEQSLLDLNSGRRRGLLLRVGDAEVAAGEAAADAAVGQTASDSAVPAVVGAAIVGGGELDLVAAPGFRRRGYATAAVTELLSASAGSGSLTAWSHGDHPAARALAARFGFFAERTLLQLRLSPIPAPARPADRADRADITIEPFRPGLDDDEWIALNALVFSHHPEQGGLTRADLDARQAEPWFDADDFLIARDDSGRMIGYDWLKVEPPEPAASAPAAIGEIYVIGIHPDAAGRGLGRLLMAAGLRRLSERGITTASLYVDADNESAVHLYRSLGFTDFTVDVQYRLTPAERNRQR